MARPALTRESVIEATRDMIAAEGLEGVSLRKVAANLGVTAPALYAHFASKSDLLQAIAEDEFRAMISRFGTTSDLDPVEKVRQMCHQYLDYARENPRLFATMFMFRPELTGEPRGNELPLATEAFSVAAGPVTEAIESGAFRPADPFITSITIWTAIHGAAIVFLAGPSLDDNAGRLLADNLIETVIRGLMA